MMSVKYVNKVIISLMNTVN